MLDRKGVGEGKGVGVGGGLGWCRGALGVLRPDIKFDFTGGIGEVGGPLAVG